MHQRRHEKPISRKNPSGDRVWVARWTNCEGERTSGGTFKLKGPCRAAGEKGLCCAQHRIDWCYEHDAPRPKRVDTIGTYAETWTQRHPRSERTNDTNDHRLSRVLDVKLDGVRLRDWRWSEIGRRQVTDLVDHMLREQKRAAAGAQGILRTLSAMAENALDDEQLRTANPFKGVTVRATDPRITKAPRKPRLKSWAEMHELAAAAGGPWEAMLRVASDCGPRLGELLAIHRADLKLTEVCDEMECPYAQLGGPRGAHLHIRHSAHDGRVLEGPFGTKREKLRQVDEGGRVVPVPAALEVLLRGLPRRIDSPLLFPTPQGRVWWEDNFRDDVWNPARKASGVNASPQDFRHSWVSHLRAAGVDPADLAQMAGHSVQTATNVYTHSLGRSYDVVAKAVGA